MRTTGRRIEVLFGSREALKKPLPINRVLIVPSSHDWNDFGYSTRIDIRIRLEESTEEYDTFGFIGFLGEENKEINGTNRLRTIIEETSKITIVAGDSHHYFTMLPTMEAYRSIVQYFGATLATEILKSIKDVVALGEFKTKINWLEMASQTDVFKKSFVRNSESFFAYKNAGSILRGLAFEEFYKMSQELEIRFKLSSRLNEHHLKFRFGRENERDLPKRIAVIIGKNGVGKSQALGRIVRAALKGDDSLIDGRTGARPSLNRILAFAPTNEARSVFPTDKQRRPKIWYRRYSLNRSENRRAGAGVSDLVVQLARSTEHIGETERWEIFIEALVAIDNYSQIALPTLSGDDEFILLSKLKRANELRVLEKYAEVNLKKEPVRVIEGKGYPLSSGEISFLKFAAQASLDIENGALLLLDEPETHLHPNFIGQFVSLLDNLLEKTGSAAIIATHSAYFVREVFREQVTILSTSADGLINAARPTLRTFGADVGAISYFVFGEDQSSKLAMKVEQHLLSKYSSWEELYADHKDELSLELLSSLRSAMEA